MTTGLDNWLAQATRRLAKDSAARVRTEIQEHYDLARDAAIADGATVEGADAIALKALGDAKTMNCQYRQVLLTSSEARMLREFDWEASAVCSRPWLRWLVMAMPLLSAAAACVLFFQGRTSIARDLLMVSFALGCLQAPFFMSISTPQRGRIFRSVKWLVVTGTLVVILGHDTLKWSWLVLTCLSPLALTEITRASIRRKLPVGTWPRQLFY